MIPFAKFHGTGNDFILIDGFTTKFINTPGRIKEMCDRRFGIGADGLIIISPSDSFDFEMIYYNADGSKATMCGNGARCAVAFGQMLGVHSGSVSFLAGDGPHTAKASLISNGTWDVCITMKDVNYPVKTDEGWYINTGTPHFVKLVNSVKCINLLEEGRLIRNQKSLFAPDGVNVNWFSMTPGLINVRTYEKGVEDETWSCGTGVTASALIAGTLTNEGEWDIETKGGRLHVSFRPIDDKFTNVTLQGPAQLVFTGEIHK